MEVIERCFPEKFAPGADASEGPWQTGMKKMIPQFGKKLNGDPKLAKEVLKRSAESLGIRDLRDIFEKGDDHYEGKA